jgi:hypothetical protein
MAIIATENWQAYRPPGGTPLSAYREYHVTGTADHVAAFAAIPYRENVAFSTNSALKCQRPSVIRHDGLQDWHIGCQFTIPTGGGNHPTQDDDLLGKPTVIAWSPVEVTEQADRDMDGRPLLYSNGDPIGGEPRTISYLAFTLFRYYTAFDPNWVKTYANSVNSATATFQGFTFSAQHLWCKHVYPVSEYAMGDSVIRVGWFFEGVLDDSLGAYPFQYRFLDQGTEGWNGNGEKAKFSNGKGEILDEPVRLDGTGKPLSGMYGTITVGKDNDPPYAPPESISVYQKETTSAGVWLIYKKTRLANHSAIPV